MPLTDQYNRNSQTLGTSTTSQNQDLLFNNASSSAAFNSPGGTTATGQTGTTTGFTTGLIAGNTYTIDYSITLSAANSVKINNELFNGSNTNGTALMNVSGTATGSSFLTASFDGLALGYRQNNAPGGAITASLDINQITIVSDIATVPEPTVLAMSAFGGLGLLAVRRWQQRK
jgi:hypothetical protein